MLPKNPLFRGLVKTAIVTTCGIFTGMPAVDPEHFNFMHLSGIGHMLGAIGWIVFVSECRYIQEWFDKFNGNGNGVAK